MIQLDRNSPIPLYEQLKSQIRNLLMLRLLRPGDTIGSSAQLAQNLLISPAISERALRELEKEGVVSRASGVYVISEMGLQGAAHKIEESLQNFAESLMTSRRNGISWEKLHEVYDQVKTSETKTESSTVPHFMGKQVCPYCREKIQSSEAVSQCFVCKTPHHQECWSEAEHCAVFGCSGKVPIRL